MVYIYLMLLRALHVYIYMYAAGGGGDGRAKRLVNEAIATRKRIDMISTALAS